MTGLTLDLMAATILGVWLGHDARAARGRVFGVMQCHIGPPFAMFVLPPAVPVPGRARAGCALAMLDGIADRVIERRMAHGDDVSGLLTATWGAGGIIGRQLRDEITTVLFGECIIGAAWAVFNPYVVAPVAGVLAQLDVSPRRSDGSSRRSRPGWSRAAGARHCGSESAV